MATDFREIKTNSKRLLGSFLCQERNNLDKNGQIPRNIQHIKTQS